MPEPDELYAQELAALADMDNRQLHYLANLGDIPDPETDGLGCGDDTPKLTDEEWQYVLDMNDG